MYVYAIYIHYQGRSKEGTQNSHLEASGKSR